MDKPQHDDALEMYQRPWRRMALVVSLGVFLIWTCRWLHRAGWASDVLGFVGECSTTWKEWHDEPGPCTYTSAFAAVAWLQPLLLLSPMLVWFHARRRIQRTSAPVTSPSDGYRVACLEPRSWRVSGPFPRWPAAMSFVSLLLHAITLPYLVVLASGVTVGTVLYLVCSVLSWGHAPCDPIVETLLTEREGLAQLCILYAWWRLCRRDASRVGVLRERMAQGGAQALVLRTPSEVRPVTMASCDASSRELRVDGSAEVWCAVDPIDDLARMNAPRPPA